MESIPMHHLDPLVSVIIPVYNVRPYLIEALDSTLSQTYKNLEIIIIDDGSTDGSRAICDAYAEKDDRVVVIHQENKGLSAARNMGLDRMTGDLVAFLDPDDAYDPSFIEETVAAMMRTDADLIVCRFTVHRTTGTLHDHRSMRVFPSIEAGLLDRESALRALVDGRINFGTWNKLYKRDLWNGIRFPDGHVYEDINAIIDVCSQSHTVCVIDQPLYWHRIRPGSITRTCSQDNIRDWIMAFTQYAAYVEEHIPDVFTRDHLTRVRQLQLHGMIARYLQSSRQLGKDGKAFVHDLRNQIIASGRKTGIDSFDLRTKVLYVMICWCPWLLKAIYLVYRPARQLVWMLFRR